MKDLTIMPMARIGVYPDGSPVVYDPEKAAAKRAEIAEKLREEKGIEIGKPLFISYTPELENDYVRSPETDTVELGNVNMDERAAKLMLIKQNELKALKIPPKVTDAAIDLLVDIINKYGVEVAVFLITSGWNALFGESKEKSPIEQPVVNDEKPSFEEVA